MMFMRWVATAFFLVLVAAPWMARADERGDEAIRLGKIGLERYERADWEGAREAFAQADAAFHSPVLVMYQARCLRHLGKLLEARDAYKAVADEVLPTDAPTPWVSARATATSELATLITEIPRIVISLRNPETGTVVLLDDAIVTQEVTLLTNPGGHQLVARGNGGETTQSIVVLRGTQVQNFSIAAPAPKFIVEPNMELSGSAQLGIGLTATGGAALIAGLVTGLLALDSNADTAALVAASCATPTACPAFEFPPIEDALARTQRLANATDGLLIAGSATATIGLIVLLALPLEQQVVEVSRNGVGFRF